MEGEGDGVMDTFDVVVALAKIADVLEDIETWIFGLCILVLLKDFSVKVKQK